MSTELERMNRFELRSFYGGEDLGMCIQVTCHHPLRHDVADEEGFIQLTLAEAQLLEKCLRRSRARLGDTDDMVKAEHNEQW